MLIAVEGIDGSGKATLTRSLAQAWQSLGRPARTVSFPRYGLSPLADAARELLASPELLAECGPRGSALVFAAERAASRHLLAPSPGELIVVDRYVASNAAYQSARATSASDATAISDWIFDLEFTQVGLPVPDLTILVDVPVAESASRLAARAFSPTLGDRPPSDSFESDSELLTRAAVSYRDYARAHVRGPWLALDGLLAPELLTAEALTRMSSL